MEYSEKLSFLEEVMDVEEGTLSSEMFLFNIDEWYLNLTEKVANNEIENNGFNYSGATLSLEKGKIVVSASNQANVPDYDFRTMCGDSSYYKIPVQPNTQYSFNCSAELLRGGSGQISLFGYGEHFTENVDETNGNWCYVTDKIIFSKSGRYSADFTTGANVRWIEISFGTMLSPYTIAKFSDVFLYETNNRYAGAEYVQDPNLFEYGDASGKNENLFILGEWYENIMNYHNASTGEIPQNPGYENGVLTMEGISVAPQWNLSDALGYYYVACEPNTVYEFGYKVEGAAPTSTDYAQSVVWGIGYTENSNQALFEGDYQGGNGSFSA